MTGTCRRPDKNDMDEASHERRQVTKDSFLDQLGTASLRAPSTPPGFAKRAPCPGAPSAQLEHGIVSVERTSSFSERDVRDGSLGKQLERLIELLGSESRARAFEHDECWGRDDDARNGKQLLFGQ
jgi:hypothetical protein